MILLSLNAIEVLLCTELALRMGSVSNCPGHCCRGGGGHYTHAHTYMHSALISLIHTPTPPTHTPLLHTPQTNSTGYRGVRRMLLQGALKCKFTQGTIFPKAGSDYVISEKQDVEHLKKLVIRHTISYFRCTYECNILLIFLGQPLNHY